MPAPIALVAFSRRAAGVPRHLRRGDGVQSGSKGLTLRAAPLQMNLRTAGRPSGFVGLCCSADVARGAMSPARSPPRSGPGGQIDRLRGEIHAITPTPGGTSRSSEAASRDLDRRGADCARGRVSGGTKSAAALERAEKRCGHAAQRPPDRCRGRPAADQAQIRCAHCPHDAVVRPPRPD